VVAGTATAVSGRVARRQEQRWAQQEQQQYEQQAQASQPPPAAPAAAGGDRVQQLTELASLKEKGVLTEAEFEAEKARILAG
jgi:hypothetical protein